MKWNSILFAWNLILFCSCSREVTTSNGRVLVQFENLSSETVSGPNSFKLKVKTIRLISDITSAESSNQYTGINSTVFKDVYEFPCYGTDSECGTLSTWFNFGIPTSAINTNLEATSIFVPAGVQYGYVQLELLGSDSGVNNTIPNVVWSYAPTGLSSTSFASIRTYLSAPIPGGLILTANQDVTLKIQFSLDDSVSYGTSVATIEKSVGGQAFQENRADDCAGTIGTPTYTCFIIPTFSAKLED